MKRIFILSLYGFLLCTLSGCDPSSRFVGCWENTVDWRATFELNSSGTFVRHNYEWELWQENGWTGKWRVERYQPPYTNPDSLRDFLDGLPVGIKKYMNQERMPEYEIVCYDMFYTCPSELAGRPRLTQEERRLVLSHGKNEMTFTNPPLYNYLGTWYRVE